MRHKIIFSHSDGINQAYELCGLVRRAIITALEAECVYVPCEINVLFTDNSGIRSINKDMRGVDSATDVLSFPMYEFIPGKFEADASMLDEDSCLLPLGDIALSIDRIEEQAHDFVHSISREAAYLTVHSVLHLLGYDHLDEGEMKAQMRTREEAIMEQLCLPRQ